MMRIKEITVYKILTQILCKHKNILVPSNGPSTCEDCEFPMKKKPKDFSLYSPAAAKELGEWIGTHTIVPDRKAWLTNLIKLKRR